MLFDDMPRYALARGYDPQSTSIVYRRVVGIRSIVYRMPTTVTESALMLKIDEYNHDPKIKCVRDITSIS